MADEDIDYGQKTRSELVGLLKGRGLKASGKNEEMVQRLIEDDDAKAAAAAEASRAPRRRREQAVTQVQEVQRRRGAQPEPQAEEEDVTIEDEVGGYRGLGYGAAPVVDWPVDQIRAMMAQESRRVMGELTREVSSVVADAATNQKETLARQQAIARWRDMTFNSRSDHEYDVLKVVGRDLFVLSKTVSDPVLAGRIAANHKKLEERAATLFIAEKFGFAAAEATFIPADSLFVDYEKRIEKAQDESRKRKKEDTEVRGGPSFGGPSFGGPGASGVGFGGSRQWGPQVNASSSPSSSGSRVDRPTCYNCGQTGHLRNRCPRPFQPGNNNNFVPQFPMGQFSQSPFRLLGGPQPGPNAGGPQLGGGSA